MKATDLLTNEAKKKAEHLRVELFEDKEKYSVRQYAKVYKGYDFLQNIQSVRFYIQKRYDVDYRTLELLLKLMGMKIFTRQEFSALPKHFGIHRFRHVRSLGYIDVLSKDNKSDNQLYTLSTKAKNICIKFYKCLSGEEKIPEDGHYNPMANRNKKTKFDKKRMDMIKQMNSLPIKDHIKTLF